MVTSRQAALKKAEEIVDITEVIMDQLRSKNVSKHDGLLAIAVIIVKLNAEDADEYIERARDLVSILDAATERSIIERRAS